MSKRASTKRTYTKVGKHADKPCPTCFVPMKADAEGVYSCAKHGKPTKP